MSQTVVFSESSRNGRLDETPGETAAWTSRYDEPHDMKLRFDRKQSQARRKAMVNAVHAVGTNGAGGR